MRTSATEDIIESIMLATYGAALDARRRYAFEQALRGLVRLARAEHLLELRMDVDRATAMTNNASGRRQTRALLRKIGMDMRLGQRLLASELQAGAARPDPALPGGGSGAGGDLVAGPQQPEPCRGQ
ncbi:hypothetical protein HSX11_24125 [Oxalobacteraceae bacterium]|nr:hypothetical protein [Oxalobacteraceae bacterium]